MDRIRHTASRVAFLALFTLLSTGIAASMATPATATNALGSYHVHISWTQAGNETFDIKLTNHGEGRVIGSHDTLTYTINKRWLRITITSPTSATSYHGLTTRDGINTANHPGKVTTSTGDDGTWYAIPITS